MDYHFDLKQHQSLCNMNFTLKCKSTSGCLEGRKLIPWYSMVCLGKAVSDYTGSVTVYDDPDYKTTAFATTDLCKDFKR